MSLWYSGIPVYVLSSLSMDFYYLTIKTTNIKSLLSVLFRMKEANIPCPDVVALKKHVLVMSFIGKDMLPAPKIKDVDLPFVDLTIMYDQTAEVINL